MNQKHCKFCGRVIDADSKFCSHCGGNIESIEPPKQNQTDNQMDFQGKEENTPVIKSEQNVISSDHYFTIGLITFLISLFWVVVNRFIEDAYEYNDIWMPINILTVSAVPILCTIFAKKQSYRIVLGIMATITIFYYVFVFYIE